MGIDNSDEIDNSVYINGKFMNKNDADKWFFIPKVGSVKIGKSNPDYCVEVLQRSIRNMPSKIYSAWGNWGSSGREHLETGSNHYRAFKETGNIEELEAAVKELSSAVVCLFGAYSDEAGNIDPDKKIGDISIRTISYAINGLKEFKKELKKELSDKL